MLPLKTRVSVWGQGYRSRLELTFSVRVLILLRVRASGSNCRIPCHFKDAPLKSVDTRIRRDEEHPSPRHNLSIDGSGYADTRIRSGKDYPSPRHNLTID